MGAKTRRTRILPELLLEYRKCFHIKHLSLRLSPVTCSVVRVGFQTPSKYDSAHLFIGNEGLGSPKVRLVLFTTIWWLWEAKVPYVQL
jgi:hypothetical protein